MAWTSLLPSCGKRSVSRKKSHTTPHYFSLHNCDAARLKSTASKEHAQLAAAQKRSPSSFQVREQLVSAEETQPDSILKALTRLESKIDVNTKELKRKLVRNTKKLDDLEKIVKQTSKEVVAVQQKIENLESTNGHLLEAMIRFYFHSSLSTAHINAYTTPIMIKRVEDLFYYLTLLCGDVSIHDVTRKVVDAMLLRFPDFLKAFAKLLGIDDTNFFDVDGAFRPICDIKQAIQQVIAFLRSKSSQEISKEKKKALKSQIQVLKCVDNFFTLLDMKPDFSELALMLLIWDTDNSIFQKVLGVDMRGVVKMSDRVAAGTGGEECTCKLAYEVNIGESKASSSYFPKARKQLILRTKVVRKYVQIAMDVAEASFSLHGTICYVVGDPKLSDLVMEEDGVTFSYMKAELGIEAGQSDLSGQGSDSDTK